MTTSATQSTPAITSADRRSFSLFLATAFHAVILLGLSFAMPDKTIQQFQRSLDVVLATQFTDQRPDEADFIGHNQKTFRLWLPKLKIIKF